MSNQNPIALTNHNYYMLPSRSGKIVSPNYMDGIYKTNTKQDICLKSEPGDCGVEYRWEMTN